MIPNNDRITRAMHDLEQRASDVPDLFERVAAGARRRRRARTSVAMAGAAIVVAGIASVPALTSGTHPSRHAPALGQPRNGIDPGFTGVSPQPSEVLPTAPVVSPPEVSPGRAISAAPTPLPTNSAGCPLAGALPPGPMATEQATAAALAAAPTRYGDAGAKATVTKVYPAASGQGFGIVADAICGKTLGDNSYVVELGFGDPASGSASLGSGQLFVASFPGAGWQVWFQYH